MPTWFLNQAHVAKGQFLEIALIRTSVCVCVCVCLCMCVSVCPPQRALVTSGMIWCDIGRV